MSQLSELLNKIPPDAKVQLYELMLDVGVALCDNIPKRMKYIDTGEHKDDINLIIEGVCLQGKSLLNSWRKYQEPNNPSQ